MLTKAILGLTIDALIVYAFLEVVLDSFMLYPMMPLPLVPPNVDGCPFEPYCD